MAVDNEGSAYSRKDPRKYGFGKFLRPQSGAARFAAAQAMVRTCHQCHGHSDNYSEANLKRCAGCQKVYYCSTTCQKDDWIAHIFECNPKRPLNTADYLALAARKNVFPAHPQTFEDYGFSRAVNSLDRVNLLGLYIGLFEVLKISSKTIHDWRIRGVLVEQIKAAFYKLPERSRGEYFSWFLQNEHIIALAGQPVSMETWTKEGDAMVQNAWRFVGENANDPPSQIRAEIARRSDEEQDSFWLYVHLLSRAHPGPSDGRWVEFGFASCASEEEEMELGCQYQRLICMCPFSEFCDAYGKGRLIDLFRSKGLQVKNSSHFADVVCGPRGGRKSVWRLKALVLQDEDAGDEPRIVPPVMADYGFMNCQNASERRQLKRVYRAFFQTHGGDPFALHEAAIRGELHSFLSKHVRGLRDPKFQRLMKNLYPLPGA